MPDLQIWQRLQKCVGIGIVCSVLLKRTETGQMKDEMGTFGKTPFQ